MRGFVRLWKMTIQQRMIEKTAHRGPDEIRVIRAPNVPVMAHCRLSIFGPKDGSQLIYRSENLLVANGEIYNQADAPLRLTAKRKADCTRTCYASSITMPTWCLNAPELGLKIGSVSADS
jgi:asparagine synthetase B (glutamine-hydrolysing)